MDINFNDLDKFNLLSLRVFARKLGIDAPTKKTKVELIEEIKKFSSGEKGSETKKLKRGRPCLNSLDLEEEITFSKVNRIREIQKRYVEKFNEHFDRFIEKVKKEREEYLLMVDNVFNEED